MSQSNLSLQSGSLSPWNASFFATRKWKFISEISCGKEIIWKAVTPMPASFPSEFMRRNQRQSCCHDRLSEPVIHYSQMSSNAVMHLLVWSACEKGLNSFQLLQERCSLPYLMVSGQKFASNLLIVPTLVYHYHRETSFSILMLKLSQ